MQPITLAVTLTDEQAQAFAQFLKRVSLSHYQALAANLQEAYLMQEAGQAIGEQLQAAGYAPR